MSIENKAFKILQRISIKYSSTKLTFNSNYYENEIIFIISH